jgi:galactokinase/mevalonate kinase-like predicted kinase
MKPRPQGYSPLGEKNLEHRWIKQLGESGELCYRSILAQNLKGFGESLTRSLEAWRKILPLTAPEAAVEELAAFSDAAGATFSGAGGGYLLVVSARAIQGALRIKIRR